MTMRDNRSPHKSGIRLSSLDFRNNTWLTILSYLLRLIGAVVFGGLFFQIVQRLRPDEALTLMALVSIGIDGVPAIASIILVVLDVIGVLVLHECIHAAVFAITSGAPPRIGIRGAMIFASAEGYLTSRNAMLVNAIAPFAVISALGLLLLPVVPSAALAWIFIPTVVNAAAAAGDAMAVAWLATLPTTATIEDHGDVLVAYSRNRIVPMHES
ncbi:DUF3267 domain-containing protein [Oscillochloris sp. ZM17-4]|uniref:DUF3267 domain-containing protein n=1 Tax=Oscillochloris sp. ZM17-4 TaxID=2866714 RepID=UPI001C7308A1|nr:DUF3267 domain-containing protein [Oscillochloris sp. ZM17-4]MBX0329681.1 DUF3267 domain-containing protein [Oscillochloris sp. ZM17-4]